MNRFQRVSDRRSHTLAAFFPDEGVDERAAGGVLDLDRDRTCGLHGNVLLDRRARFDLEDLAKASLQTWESAVG